MKFRIKHVEGKGYYLQVKKGWLECWEYITKELTCVSGIILRAVPVPTEGEVVKRKEEFLNKIVKPLPPRITYTYL